MAFSRYARAPILAMGAQYGTSRAIAAIRAAIKSGQIGSREVVLRGADRLDTLAGALYGSGEYWWILAAASDVGWGLQVPAGTIIRVPALGDVAALVS